MPEFTNPVFQPIVAPQAKGWLCPKCGKAHAPTVLTCPERANSLGLMEVHNG